MNNRLLYILLFMFVWQNSFCQEHLTFMDIPITGSVNDFVAKLKQKGDYQLSKKQNSYQSSVTKTFDGKYANWALCSIDVNMRNDQDYVSFITVHLDKYASQANQILHYLEEKYGDFVKEEDHFGTNYIWTLENGTIRYNFTDKLGDTYYLSIQFRDNSYYSKDELEEMTNQKIENDKHISFMGKSFNCDVAEMASYLETKGFDIDWKNCTGKMYVLKGMFLEKPVTICLNFTPSTKKMTSILIVFPPLITWSAGKAQYNKFKTYYLRKYSLHSVREEFKKPYFDGCGEELMAIKKNNATYMSMFETKGGKIGLSILSSVTILYYDDINYKLQKDEEVSELNI